jgi:F-type H+-transporting ATPase subunit delta
MKSPRQTKREATQLFRACFANGTLDEKRVREVVKQIIAAKPRGFLQMLLLFRRLVKLETVRRTANIESAVPLSAVQQASVQASLVKTYGEGLTISFNQNTALIGGMRIKVGSDVYDGSIQAHLAAIEESF